MITSAKQLDGCLRMVLSALEPTKIERRPSPNTAEGRENGASISFFSHSVSGVGRRSACTLCRCSLGNFSYLSCFWAACFRGL